MASSECNNTMWHIPSQMKSDMATTKKKKKTEGRKKEDTPRGKEDPSHKTCIWLINLEMGRDTQTHHKQH